MANEQLEQLSNRGQPDVELKMHAVYTLYQPFKADQVFYPHD